MTDREALEKLWDAANDYLHALSNRTAALHGERLGVVLKDIRKHVLDTSGYDHSNF